LALAYSVLDLSLRSVAAWSAEQGIGRLSDVAVLGRLRRGWPSLLEIFTALLAETVSKVPCESFARRIRLVDATGLGHPGASGAVWRLHVGYDLAMGVVDAVELTDAHGGENLGRAKPSKGDLIVADRGYAHEHRIRDTLEAGADVLLRIGHRAVPLVDQNVAEVDPLQFATQRRPTAGRPPRAESRTVFLRTNLDRKNPILPIVVRKSFDAAERDRERKGREATRRGKELTQRTLDACRFAFLLTSVPSTEASDATMANVYRLRWQIELLFKRWKSLLGLSNLRADDPDLAKAYIYGKPIAAARTDRITRSWRDFSPYGLPIVDGDVAGLA
jgi:hypothetical protein